MASSSEVLEVNCSDFTKCSICFEQFKTPRYLPCSHSFCHECLSTHIVSSCKSKEDAVGFRCPLCRHFIPVEQFSNGPINWASEFPINDTLRGVATNQVENHCDTCKRDDEEQEASRYCLMCKEKLCDMCAKYHRQILLTKDHEVMTLQNLKLSPIKFKDKDICLKHPDKKVEFICKDHSLSCCSMCICVEHRACDTIETVKEAADRVRKGELNNLSEEIKNMEQELLGIKAKEEENISELDANLEKLFELTESLYTRVQNHIQQLKNNYLDQLSSKAKEHKEVLRKNAESNGDRITYLKQVAKSLESLKDEMDDAIYVAEFHKSRHKYEKLKDNKYKQSAVLFSLTSSFDSRIQEIRNVTAFGDFNFTANTHGVKDIEIEPVPQEYVSYLHAQRKKKPLKVRGHRKNLFSNWE